MLQALSAVYPKQKRIKISRCCKTTSLIHIWRVEGISWITIGKSETIFDTFAYLLSNLHKTSIILHKMHNGSIYSTSFMSKICQSLDLICQFKAPTALSFENKLFFKRKIMVGFCNNSNENAFRGKFQRNLKIFFFERKWYSNNRLSGSRDFSRVIHKITAVRL